MAAYCACSYNHIYPEEKFLRKCAMAQLSDAVVAGGQSQPRTSVRHSWSYEIVTVEGQRDPAGITESNILETGRRSKRSKRLNEAMAIELSAGWQTPLMATAAIPVGMGMDGVNVYSVRHSGQPACYCKANDTVSGNTEVEKQSSGGSPKVTTQTSLLGSTQTQQSQSGLSLLDYLPDSQPVTCLDTDTKTKLSQTRELVNTTPSHHRVPIPRQFQFTSGKTSRENSINISDTVLSYQPVLNNNNHGSTPMSSNANVCQSAILNRAPWNPVSSRTNQWEIIPDSSIPIDPAFG